MPLILFLSLKIAMAIQGLYSLINILGFFSYFCEKCHWILTDIILNVQMALGRMDSLTILILSIHKHGLAYLFVSFFSFINVLQFSTYRFFTSVVKIIPKYFILSDAIVSGIVFLISLSESLVFLIYNIMSPINRDNFTSFFLIQMPFFFWLHPWHMEVPGPGSNPSHSCDLCHSPILNLIQINTSTETSWILNLLCHRRAPDVFYLFIYLLLNCSGWDFSYHMD